MNRHWLCLPSVAMLAFALTGAASAQSTNKAPAQSAKGPAWVEVVRHEPERRVDILVGGRPFTSYVWPTSLKKPVLYPLRSASGTLVTRGFPLDPQPGERVDHPHQAGLWFTYGDVNGLDFWNNSDSIKASAAPQMGTVLHRSIRGATSGDGAGTLDVTEEWVDHTNRPLLREDTRFVFRASAGVRTIDRITTLTALDSAVHFTDNKEGVIGLRVARWLEQPSLTPEKYVDASGRLTEVARLDTAGVHGHYLSSEGREGDAVWGTRGKWVLLTGDNKGEQITLALLDHAGNVGYPAYWHARGYGLFAANPLGQKAMSDGKAELNFVLAPKASVTFRHRLLILNGKASTADVERYFISFAH